MTQEAAVRDLDNERSRLKDKVLRLEEEREALHGQSQALDERHKQQLQSLHKVQHHRKIDMQHFDYEKNQNAILRIFFSLLNIAKLRN